MSRSKPLVCLLAWLLVLSACASTATTPPAVSTAALDAPASDAAASAPSSSISLSASALAEASISPQAAAASVAPSPAAAASASAAATASASAAASTAAASAAGSASDIPDATAAASAAASASNEAAVALPSAAATSALATLLQRDDARTAELAATCPQKPPFPLPDPPVSVKRPLDFVPFSAAIDALSAEQATAVEAALNGQTVPQIQALLGDGTLSSERLLAFYVQRIQRYDENRLNAVMELNPQALTDAQALDAERAAGTVRGPLHGIPVLLKDNIATAGPMHTTAGNFALRDWQADRDAFLVTRLRDAGALILGKANLSEWAYYTDPCTPSGFSALGGQARNPYGPFDPLGSSTGSAVAVAANLTTISVGSETAGSLIQPSRVNGIVGMRPSKGLISGDYIIPLAPVLDTAGPMGRSVTDVAVLLTALAGEDPNDPETARAAALRDTDFTQYLSLDEARKLRVGVVIPDDIISAVVKQDYATLSPLEQAQVLDTLQQLLLYANQPVIDALRSQGLDVVLLNESQLPVVARNSDALIDYGFKDGIDSFLGGLAVPAPVSSLAEIVAVINEDPAARAPYGQREVEDSATTTTTAEQYEAAFAEARQVAEDWITGIVDANDVDVLLTGVRYLNAGPAGVPALTIPIGQASGGGQPTSVVLTGAPLSDAKLIAVGYALEQALGVQLAPDLEATIQQIDNVTGRE